MCVVRRFAASCLKLTPPNVGINRERLGHKVHSDTTNPGSTPAQTQHFISRGVTNNLIWKEKLHLKRGEPPSYNQTKVKVSSRGVGVVASREIESERQYDRWRWYSTTITLVSSSVEHTTLCRQLFKFITHTHILFLFCLWYRCQ